MAYPTDLLDVDVELQVGAGGTWVNVTQHVSRAGNDRIVIERGRQDPRSQVTPSSLKLTLLDPDGRYSPRNPTGPYYGRIGRNTPIRVIVNAGAGPSTRFVGEIGALPQTWEPGDVLRRVSVQAAGIMRRLQQGRAALPSALRQGVIDDVTLIGDGVYWPMEDGTEANSAAVGYGLGEPLLPWGAASPLFGRVDGPPGSENLPDFSAQGALVAGIPSSIPDTGEWQFGLWFRTNTGDSSTFTACVPLQVDFEGGTIPAFDVLLFIGEGQGGDGLGTIGFNVAAYTPTPPALPSESSRSEDLALIVGGIPNVQGTWRELTVTFTQVSPGTVGLAASLDGDSISLGSASDTTWTLGRPSRIVINPTQDAPNADSYAGVDGIGISSIGHVVVKNGATAGIVYPAGLGWNGEPAGTRMDRLTTENGVAFSFAGGGQLCGPQAPGRSLLDLLRDAETVDGGVLYEARDAAALAWRPTHDMYNQAAALTLAYGTAGHVAPPLPVADDDLGVRNRVTVQRAAGGRRTVSRDTGPLSTQPPPVGVGVYDESLTLACHTDEQAELLASWRVHLGTWDEPRVQAVTLYLHALAAVPTTGAALLAAAIGLDIGDRFDITGLPARIQPTATLLAQRFREVIGETDWQITVTPSPAGPYTVAVIESATLGRLDHDASTVNTSVLSTASTISVASTGTVWRTSASFPFQVTAAGVVWNVTAISGASSPQTFTVNLANAVTKTVPAGSPLALASPMRLAQ